MTPINRKRAGDVLYRASMDTREDILLYAESIREAHQRAIEFYRPKKHWQRESIKVCLN